MLCSCSRRGSSRSRALLKRQKRSQTGQVAQHVALHGVRRVLAVMAMSAVCASTESVRTKAVSFADDRPKRAPPEVRTIAQDDPAEFVCDACGSSQQCGPWCSGCFGGSPHQPADGTEPDQEPPEDADPEYEQVCEMKAGHTKLLGQGFDKAAGCTRAGFTPEAVRHHYRSVCEQEVHAVLAATAVKPLIVEWCCSTVPDRRQSSTSGVAGGMF